MELYIKSIGEYIKWLGMVGNGWEWLGMVVLDHKIETFAMKMKLSKVFSKFFELLLLLLLFLVQLLSNSLTRCGACPGALVHVHWHMLSLCVCVFFSV